MCCRPLSFIIFPSYFHHHRRHHLLRIMAQRLKKYSLSEHTCVCTQLCIRQPLITPKFDFKVSLLEPLACLVNQTLFCLVSQPGWLVAERPHEGQQKERNLTHTNTSKFQTVADGFNSLPSFFHNLSGNLLWTSVLSFHALLRSLNAASVCQKMEKKKKLNSTN